MKTTNRNVSQFNESMAIKNIQIERLLDENYILRAYNKALEDFLDSQVKDVASVLSMVLDLLLDRPDRLHIQITKNSVPTNDGEQRANGKCFCLHLLQEACEKRKSEP